MDEQYSNEMRGVLFRNDKEGNENRPDYTGKIQINGVELRLAAWIKEGKSGKFMSLNVSEFQKKPEAKPAGDADPFNSADPFASSAPSDCADPSIGF